MLHDFKHFFVNSWTGKFQTQKITQPLSQRVPLPIKITFSTQVLLICLQELNKILVH